MSMWNRRVRNGGFQSALAAALMMLASTAQAGLIVKDSFNYTAGTSLNGQSGGQGAWAGNTSWVGATTAIDNQTTIVNPSTPLAVPGLSGGGSAVQINQPASTINDGSFFSRGLGTSVNATSVYVSFLFRTNGSGDVDANEFFSLWLSNTATGNHTGEPNIGLKGNPGGGGPAGSDIQVRVSQGNEAFAANSSIISGPTYQIVGHLFKSSNNVAGVYDRFALWVNPSYAQLANNTGFVLSSGSTGLTSFNTLGFRTAGLKNDNLPILFDELTLGTSFSDVAPAPEPGTLILVASSLPIAGLYYRRRRIATKNMA